MQPPNLQAILIDYVDVAWRAVEDGDTNYEALNKAIDAIYAGLLAVVIDKTHEIYLTKDENGVVDMHDDVIAHWDSLREKQRECLKRWCYGDTSNG